MNQDVIGLSVIKCTEIIRQKQGVGCGRAVRFTDKGKVLEHLKSYPDASGIELRDAIALDLPMSTFYDTLGRFNITYKKRTQV